MIKQAVVVRNHKPYAESPNLPKPKKPRQVKSKVKSMLIIFFDIKRIVHQEYFLTGHTVNSASYCKVLRRLRENVRRLQLELWLQENCLLHHDNAQSQTSFFTRECFDQKQDD
jgi:hypothetical protein